MQVAIEDTGVRCVFVSFSLPSILHVTIAILNCLCTDNATETLLQQLLDILRDLTTHWKTQLTYCNTMTLRVMMVIHVLMVVLMMMMMLLLVVVVLVVMVGW